MTACDEGKLMAFLDGEVSAAERAEIERHLSSCALCRSRLKELEEGRQFVGSLLGAYEARLAKKPVDASSAWQRWSVRQGKKGVLSLLKNVRKGVAAAAAGALVAVVLTLGPVQAAAANFLQIFRVNKVATVRVSQEDIQSILAKLRETGGAADLRDFGRIEVQGRDKAHKVESWAGVTGVLGQEVKEPAVAQLGLVRRDLYWKEAFDLKLQLNVRKLNQVVRALGGSKLLPEGLNQKEFTISFSGFAAANYDRSEPAGEGQPRFLSLVVFKAPEITVPPGVDVEELRSALLDLPLLPGDLKERLAAVRDWQRTLVIPDVDGSTREVKVGDSSGVWLSEGGRGRLLWQRNGLWFMLDGYELTLEQALALGRSME